MGTYLLGATISPLQILTCTGNGLSTLKASNHLVLIIAAEVETCPHFTSEKTEARRVTCLVQHLAARKWQKWRGVSSLLWCPGIGFE